MGDETNKLKNGQNLNAALGQENDLSSAVGNKQTNAADNAIEQSPNPQDGMSELSDFTSLPYILEQFSGKDDDKKDDYKIVSDEMLQQMLELNQRMHQAVWGGVYQRIDKAVFGGSDSANEVEKQDLTTMNDTNPSLMSDSSDALSAQDRKATADNGAKGSELSQEAELTTTAENASTLAL